MEKINLNEWVCPRCGRPVTKVNPEYCFDKYSYECNCCDENFYTFECLTHDEFLLGIGTLE